MVLQGKAAIIAACATLASNAQSSPTQERFDLEQDVRIAEAQVALACGAETPGDARAYLAQIAYTRVENTVQRLTQQMRSVNEYLNDPGRRSRIEHQQAMTEARITLRERLRNRDWIQKGRIPAGDVPVKSVALSVQSGVEAARARLGALENPSPEYRQEAARRTRARIDQALADLRYLAEMGRRLDLAQQAAHGCYSTAMNLTKLANPEFSGANPHAR